MKLLPLAAGLVVLGAAAPAVAQSTRSFPDAKCSYTLPAAGWSWLAPNALPFPGGPTLALARSTGGLVVGLQVTDIGDDRRFFARVEADLAGGSVKAVDRRRVTFLGVSGYEVD